MPTARPRHMITESDRLSSALNAARTLWPDAAEDRGLLLRKILEVGIETVEKEHEKKVVSRLNELNLIAGSLTGIWPSNWRDELRDEWPT